MNYKAKNKEFLNYKVVYVPLNTDNIYPIYVPVVLNDENVLRSSGRLSENDYNETIKLNNKCGFPIAAILTALAPIVIPGLIKGTQAIMKKIRGSGEDTTILNAGYIPTNPNIKTLKSLQNLYDRYK